MICSKALRENKREKYVLVKWQDYMKVAKTPKSAMEYSHYCKLLFFNFPSNAINPPLVI